jgi:hypothetical protein
MSQPTDKELSCFAFAMGQKNETAEHSAQANRWCHICVKNVEEHCERKGAIWLSALCPDIKRFSSLHHNAWRQGVAMSVHQFLVSVILNVAHLQQRNLSLLQ